MIWLRAVRNVFFGVSVFPTLLLSSLLMTNANAAVITVDNSGDAGVGCTLRDALAVIEVQRDRGNGCTPVGVLGSNDTIEFTVSSIVLTQSDMEIENPVAINVGGSEVSISPAPDSRVFRIKSDGPIELERLRISGGAPLNRGNLNLGGAILITRVSGADGSITIRDSVFENNSAIEGGAIRASGITGQFTMIDSKVIGSKASRDGGGIYISGANTTLERVELSGNRCAAAAVGTSTTITGSGGGIYSRGSGVLTISDSLIANNQCVASSDQKTYGGGIHSRDNLVLRNSTVSGNVAGGNTTLGGRRFGGGGGIACFDNCVLENNTVTGNSAVNGGKFGAFFYRGFDEEEDIPGNLVFKNNIIAGNSAPGGSAELSFYPPSGASGNNILGDISNTLSSAFTPTFAPRASDITATSDGNRPTAISAIIEPLADNGGATQTHALPDDSIAINAGDQSFCTSAGIVNDQRGEVREAPCDIGAFEFMAAEPPTTEPPVTEPPVTDETCFVTKANNGNAVVYCL